jgi:hypothetical protein
LTTFTPVAWPSAIKPSARRIAPARSLVTSNMVQPPLEPLRLKIS